MKFTVEDLFKARDKDFEAQKKMCDTRDAWHARNPHRYPNRFCDVFEFTDEDKQAILEQMPDYNEMMAICKDFDAAVGNGTIKLSSWQNVLKQSVKKWLKTVTLPESMRFSDYNYPHLVYCGTDIALYHNGAQIRVDSIVDVFVRSIYNDADDVVQKNDALVQLHKKAFDLYRECCERGNFNAIPHLGYTTSGYRDNCSLMLFDGTTGNNRIPNEEELKQIISAMEEYKKQVELINQAIAAKISVKY